MPPTSANPLPMRHCERCSSPAHCTPFRSRWLCAPCYDHTANWASEQRLFIMRRLSAAARMKRRPSLRYPL